MKYKLIAIDIDGTLLDPKGQIRPRVRAAVETAVAQGCLVTLATGRRQISAREVAQDLGVALPLILYNGSLIYDTAREEALYHNAIPAEFIRQSAGTILSAGMQPILAQSPLSGERVYLGPAELDSQFIRAFATNPLRAHLITRVDLEEMPFLPNILNISTVGPASAITPLMQVFQAHMDCQIYSYGLRQKVVEEVLNGFDVMRPDVHKGIALRRLAKHYGIEISQTMAIGDNFNDVDMLIAAGLGVAMGNAAAEVKAAADVIVASNGEDGVAEAIEKFVLG
jgi:5-amino-6-(5-phospho-D-ribitylamino)uracil phosphatase